MGWTGAYPILSRKRPTASLVSRKVLAPLLGQMALCIALQAIGFAFVRQQGWLVTTVAYAYAVSTYILQVYSASPRYGEIEHHKFRQHGTIQSVNVSIRVFRGGAQHWPSI